MKFTPIVEGYDLIAHLNDQGLAYTYEFTPDELEALRTGGEIPTPLFIKTAGCIISNVATFPPIIQDWANTVLTAQMEAIPKREVMRYIAKQTASFSQFIKDMTDDLRDGTEQLKRDGETHRAQMRALIDELKQAPKNEVHAATAPSSTTRQEILEKGKRDIFKPDGSLPGNNTRH